jgi:hypothetical protein
MMKGLDDDVQSQRSTVVSAAVVILFKNLTKVFCWAAHAAVKEYSKWFSFLDSAY